MLLSLLLLLLQRRLGKLLVSVMLRAPAFLQCDNEGAICRLLKTELHSTGVTCSSCSAAAGAAFRLARAIATEHIALLLLALLALPLVLLRLPVLC